MEISKNHKIFKVGFGEPNSSGFYSDRHHDLVIIAEDYEEAAMKASRYAEFEQERKALLDSDGSLKKKNVVIKVKSVELISENIII